MKVKYYTNIKGASDKTGYSVSYIRKLVDQGRLKANHRGSNNELIFSIENLEKFINYESC